VRWIKLTARTSRECVRERISRWRAFSLERKRESLWFRMTFVPRDACQNANRQELRACIHTCPLLGLA
jgi:hypothetical protein